MAYHVPKRGEAIDYNPNPLKPPEEKAFSKTEQLIDFYFPRRRYGDLYCVVCDAQMDTKKMWENHMKGNRHYYNAGRYKYSDDEPSIQKELDKETRPLAGLDHICEIMHANHLTVYQCFLCSAGMKDARMLMFHVMGLKHQMAFLKEHAKKKYSLVDSLVLTKSDLEPIVESLIHRYEQKYGRGKMSVKKERIPYEYASSTYDYTSSYKKRSYDEGYGSLMRASYERYSPPPKYSRSLLPEYDKVNVWADRRWNVFPIDGRLRDTMFADEKKQKKHGFEYRETPMHKGIQDSRLENDKYSNHTQPSFSEGKICNDLREFLELKKNNGISLKAEKSSFLTEINVSDKLLHLIDDTSPEEFLWLILLKFDKIDMTEEIELKLLDRVINKASALSFDMKKRLQLPNLKDAIGGQSSISPRNKIMVANSTQTNLQFTQNLDILGGHEEASESIMDENVGTKESNFKPLEQNIKDKSLTSQQLNNVPIDQEKDLTANSDDQIQQNKGPVQYFQSVLANIPGLTMTEKSTVQSPTITEIRTMTQQSPVQPSTIREIETVTEQSPVQPSTSTSQFGKELRKYLRERKLATNTNKSTLK